MQAGEASAAPSLAAAALDKLKRVHELIMHAGDARQTRLAYQLGALMAREQLVAQDPASARRLLQSVAGSALPHHTATPSPSGFSESHYQASVLSLLRSAYDRAQRADNVIPTAGNW